MAFWWRGGPASWAMEERSAEKKGAGDKIKKLAGLGARRPELLGDSVIFIGRSCWLLAILIIFLWCGLCLKLDENFQLYFQSFPRALRDVVKPRGTEDEVLDFQYSLVGSSALTGRSVDFSMSQSSELEWSVESTMGALFGSYSCITCETKNKAESQSFESTLPNLEVERNDWW
jgi:hypothetical protein